MNEGINIPSYLLGKKAGGGGIPPVYEEKNVSITQNGTSTITADSGYDAISKVNLSVNVPQPSGKITITQNGTDIDVSSYATADVNVSGGATPTTIAELNTAIEDDSQSFTSHLNSLINSKTPVSQSSMTLYTPNADYNIYFIFKDPNYLDYRIFWVNKITISYKMNTYNQLYITKNYLYLDANGVNIETNGSSFYRTNNKGTYRLSLSTTNQNSYYKAQGYETLQDAINAITSPSTTYTNGTNTILTFRAESGVLEDYEVYSNSLFINIDNTEQIFNPSQRLSNNETIQVIS